MTTRKIILLTGAATLLVLALFGGKAPAQADGIRCQYAEWYGVNCTRTSAPAPAPLTRAEIAAKDAEIAKWEAFCKPTKTTDSEGLTRLTYAQKGCEFGRSE